MVNNLRPIIFTLLSHQTVLHHNKTLGFPVLLEGALSPISPTPTIISKPAQWGLHRFEMKARPETRA